jgi:hypothetical protein
MAAAWTQERIDALLCGLMYAQDLRDDDARWQTVIYAMEREGLCVNAQTSAKSYYHLKAGWNQCNHYKNAVAFGRNFKLGV